MPPSPVLPGITAGARRSTPHRAGELLLPAGPPGNVWERAGYPRPRERNSGPSPLKIPALRGINPALPISRRAPTSRRRTEGVNGSGLGRSPGEAIPRRSRFGKSAPAARSLSAFIPPGTCRGGSPPLSPTRMRLPAPFWRPAGGNFSLGRSVLQWVPDPAQFCRALREPGFPARRSRSGEPAPLPEVRPFPFPNTERPLPRRQGGATTR